MNQSKTKYALERITTLYIQKVKALKEKHTKPGKELSEKERVTLIKNGKVKLKPTVRGISYYTDVVSVFDFSKYEYDDELDGKYEKELGKLKTECSKIKDEIVLGDEQQALELIRKFADS